ncbi:MAG: zf-HC2 domain-containing protein [Armatimonadetes bacterium]|nr:zf-HC2 domain-containing protein [Armatimonadota bacterium]
MRCKQTERLITDYLDNSLPARLREGVQSHLDACPRCSQEVRSIRHTIHILDARQPVAAPQELWAQLNARIAREEAARRPFMVAWRIPSLAAGVALVAVLAGWFFLRAPAAPPLPGPVESGVVARNPDASAPVAKNDTTPLKGSGKGSLSAKPPAAARPDRHSQRPPRVRHKPATAYKRPVMTARNSAGPSRPVEIAVNTQETQRPPQASKMDASSHRLAEAIRKDPRLMVAFRDFGVIGARQIQREKATEELISVIDKMRPFDRGLATMFAPSALSPGSVE